MVSGLKVEDVLVQRELGYRGMPSGLLAPNVSTWPWSNLIPSAIVGPYDTLPPAWTSMPNLPLALGFGFSYKEWLFRRLCDIEQAVEFEGRHAI